MNTITSSEASIRTSSFVRPLGVAAALATLAIASGAGAQVGPPYPPPSATVQHEYRTLNQVEPRTILAATNPILTPTGTPTSVYTISQSGSYYLTGNLAVPAGMNGIIITASDVTIDLMGFEIISGAPGTLDGIRIGVNGLRSIEVRNGSVRAMGGNGVNLVTNTATNVYVHDLRAYNNGGFGISGGQGSVVVNCVANANAQQGFIIGTYGAASNCTASNNGGDGFFLNTGCTIKDCLAVENTGDGIEVTTNCTIRDNNCVSNGLNAGSGAGIFAGTANGTDGNNRIEGNNCTRADRGVQCTSTGNFVIRNTCANNTVDWVIVATNCVATIADRRGISLPGDINGFSGGDTLEGDCCWNISY